MPDSLEWGELGAIAAVTGGTWLASGGLAWSPSIGAAACYGAALLLGHGLARDIAILLRRKLRGEPKPEAQKLACLCAESTLGLLVIAAGAALLLAGVKAKVELGQGGLTGAVAGVLALGYLIKDYVVLVRKDKDHANLIVW